MIVEPQTESEDPTIHHVKQCHTIWLFELVYVKWVKFERKQSCFRLDYMSHSLLKYKQTWLLCVSLSFLSIIFLYSLYACECICMRECLLLHAIWILQWIQMTVFKYALSLLIPWHWLYCNQVHTLLLVYSNLAYSAAFHRLCRKPQRRKHFVFVCHPFSNE